jgi:hypothetical protein
MLRLGIVDEDLVHKSEEEVNKKYGANNNDHVVMEKRVAHEEEKRLHRLKMLKEMR